MRATLAWGGWTALVDLRYYLGNMPHSLRHARRLLRTLPDDPEGILKRSWYADAAANNLVLSVAQVKKPSDKWASLKYVRVAREASKGPPFRNVERYRLQWVEGFIWAQVGLHARAEKAYRIALEGFDFLGLPWQSALVAIDLGDALWCAELDHLAELP